MLARVATWEGGSPDGIRAASEEMRGNVAQGPPPGLKTTGFMMLTDAEAGRVVMIGLFEGRAELEESEPILAGMSPPSGLGTRSSVAVYEVAAEARM